MEAVHDEETEASTSSLACLVLPVNPLPTSSDKPQVHGKGTKRKAKHCRRKRLKSLSDFEEGTDTKEILHFVEPVDVNKPSQSQAIPPMECESEEFSIDPVTQSWFTSRDSKDILSKRGHKWKQGMWSKEEVDILERNIDEYLKHYKLGDAVSVIFQMTKEERKDFYRFIARGLQRPLFAVYRRVRRMYDSKNHVGKYTAEDIEKLKELRVKYGNEWCAIGAEMGRSAASVKDKVRLLKDQCHQGKWTINEEKMLTKAVYSLFNAVPGESITTGISWSQVAVRVPTRTEKQCRAKWLNYLNWKHAGGTEWTKEDDDKLLARLAESKATDDSQVDWEEMAQNWSSVRSPQWLRSKWWMLKRHVPGHALMDLATLVKIVRTSPIASKQTKSRGPKCLATDANIAVPMATLTMPLGTSSEQVGVYQCRILDNSVGITPSSTYVIQSPTGQHAEGESSTEGYIVATVQGEQLQSNENVTVHLNRHIHHIDGRQEPCQLIISAVHKNPAISTSSIRKTSSTSYKKRKSAAGLTTRGEDIADGLPIHIQPLPVQIHLSESEDLDDDQTEENSLNQSRLMTGHEEGQLTIDISQSEQSEETHLNQSEMLEGHDRQLTGDISQSDQSEEHTLSNTSQLIGTDAVLTQQDMVPEVSEETEHQLVIVNTVPSTGLIQSVGSVDDSHLPSGVFSLSGQMLPSQSDGSDLLDSPTSH